MVSERSFSAHGVYATPLRHALGPKVAADMVKAKENHTLVWEAIKDKIWDRYVQKYRSDASAFPDHGQFGTHPPTPSCCRIFCPWSPPAPTDSPLWKLFPAKGRRQQPHGRGARARRAAAGAPAWPPHRCTTG